MLVVIALLFLLHMAAFAQEGEAPDTMMTDTLMVAEEAAPADPPEPARLDVVQDNPGDAGNSIHISWTLSPDDGAGDDDVTSYVIYRSQSPTGPFEVIGSASRGLNEFEDATTTDGEEYYYYVETVADGESSRSSISRPVKSSAQWFSTKDLDTFIIGLIISISVIFFIFAAQKGKDLYLRKIAGLEAVDEAIGRATEMGRPILFIPGILDMDDVQTVAGITILGRIARTIANYDTKLNMPVSRSIVMTTARETVKQAYVAAGRPEAYSDDMVHYLTDEQFGYVAAVDGIMVREKPATCFYLGAFFAESLIMAETGNSIGAIQIAGTAMPAQLPFFVAACDYTLIGEELFAASAYLSGEPKQLGSLKGQDVGKMIAMAAILIGCGLFTVATITGSESLLSLAKTFRSIFSAS